jgi:hypothetical protein
VAGRAKATIRSYHDAIRSFESYLVAPQYRWAEECWPPFFLSVKSASGVIAGERHLRRCGTGRATTP